MIALKRAILRRKNSLSYRTQHGAHIGDLFRSLIHTCKPNQVNPFDYLTTFQKHSSEGRALRAPPPTQAYRKDTIWKHSGIYLPIPNFLFNSL